VELDDPSEAKSEGLLVWVMAVKWKGQGVEEDVR
jgi:hypothetical protein